ncbi:PREDICTED: olfactory receptor 5V1-like [Nanorana parkeri]|uniref:olfactory receptor 5V1-like n=1 Tax=Nanorana parkeri TaxID=125878 RepID=UPI000854F2C6|nr:PREDICTED: olfactory receptor 5V1-like [Nanorana parkeri]
MIKENETSGLDFVLLGFSHLQNQRVLVFLVFLVLYSLTVFGNTITILIISLDLQLHTPMYLFLGDLSLLDICHTCVTIPKLLIHVISKDRSISYPGCVTQLFVFTSKASTECGLLAVMTYDRYLAICKPLHYTETMTFRRCLVLATMPWMAGFLQSSIHTIFTFQLSFCQPRIIDNFFCEIPSLLKLSCSATYLNEIVLFCTGSLFSLSPFVLTFFSYAFIITSVLQIPYIECRRKAFSTCGSHLAVVSMFYFGAMFVYFRPKSSYSLSIDRLVSIFYTLLTPLLNPPIYCLKNNDVKGAMKKIFIKKYKNLNPKREL